MMRLIVHPEHPEPRKIAQAARAIEQKGGVIAYPTDTVYALGCSYSDRDAIEKLYRLKGMSAKQPLAFLLPDLSEIARYGLISNAGYRLMKRLLPGPYTFILEATREVPKNLIIERNKRKTVGVRVVDHPIVAAMLAEHRQPILSTSAVATDGTSLGDPDDVRDRFGHGLDVLVDGGYTGTDPSTVVSLIRDEIEVIREGKGPVEDLAD